jgi:hypothetical protein
MANEAVIIELLGNGGDPIRYTVADGTGIPKGTLMYLSADPRTIAASSGQGQAFVGIAAAEKVANDGSTTLAVYTNGIFDLTDSGSGCTFGDILKLGGANTVATADEAGAQDLKEVVGYALETAGNSEVIAVRVLK